MPFVSKQCNLSSVAAEQTVSPVSRLEAMSLTCTHDLIKRYPDEQAITGQWTNFVTDLVYAINRDIEGVKADAEKNHKEEVRRIKDNKRK